MMSNRAIKTRALLGHALLATVVLILYFTDLVGVTFALLFTVAAGISSVMLHVWLENRDDTAHRRETAREDPGR